MTTTFCFVDTNLFLHFPTLDQIDWLDLLRCERAVIIVTATVIRELNRHKNAPISLKLRERAASSLKKLYAYSELNGPVLVRDSVELQFNTREPLLNFVSEGLSKEVPDDFLIGTILEFERNSREAKVVLRRRFPKMQKPQWFSGAELAMGAIPPDAYDLYNKRLDRFLDDYPTYLDQLQEYFNRRRRTLELQMLVMNQGTCPAKDIHIFMHFPDGFELLQNEELPQKPQTPQAPEKPKSKIENLAMGIEVAMPNLKSYLGTTQFDNISFPTPRNAQLLSIKKTKSYEVKMHVRETKHGFLTTLDPMYVVFDSHAHARSFSVEYEIHCGNAPEKQIGKVHVIVKNQRT